MHRILSTLAVAAIAALTAAPLASANHGLEGTLIGALDNGTPVQASLSYVSGNFNTQYWRFVFSAPAALNCLGFGSLEIGFTGVGCAFRTGPTGDSHNYPYNQADVHQVSVTVNGVGGTAVQAVCPDSGNPGVVCTTVVELL